MCIFFLSDYDSSHLPLNDLAVECFQLKSVDEDAPAHYFRLLLLSRGITLETEKEFIRYCRRFDGDLRACLNGLQYWLEETRFVIKVTKSRRRVKTPPVVVQNDVELEDMESVEEDFDFLRYEIF